MILSVSVFTVSKSERTDFFFNLNSTSLSFKMQGKLFILRDVIPLSHKIEQNEPSSAGCQDGARMLTRLQNTVVAVSYRDPNVIFL